MPFSFSLIYKNVFKIQLLKKAISSKTIGYEVFSNIVKESHFKGEL